jgi:PAS domain S-box-containing protein
MRSSPDQRLRDLLDAAPDAIIEVDADGKILLLNGMTEALFGYSREELLGQSVELLIPEELRAGHVSNRRHYLAQPLTRPMGSGLSLRGRRKDGSCFPVEISLSPVKSADGLGVTAIIRDISERKRAEEQFQAMQEKYTRELLARNEEIERADRLKSEFLSSVSHELRTPLHTIIGFSELLAEELKGPLNNDQRRFVGHIHRDSLHLLDLINQILDLSKIEAGRLELRRESFAVSHATEEVLSSIRPHGEAKAIRIDTNVDSAITIAADRLRFKQILLNLLSNAVKFTPENGRICVDGSHRDGCVEMSVSDNGVGIPTEQQEYVFDKFHQVQETAKGASTGTGLGLAITKALVELHGGSIWLESQPGKGSRFAFRIPAATI